MATLLVVLLGAVVLNPTGVTLEISPANAPLGARIALGIAGLIAACLPPAILTYAWYVKRLRAWSERAPADASDDSIVGPPRSRQLSEGEARAMRQASDRERIGRHDRNT